MGFLSLFRSRNIFIFFGLYFLLIALTPSISWYSRDPKYDAENVLNLKENLTVSLYYGYDNHKNRRPVSLPQPAWQMTNVPYYYKRYLLNKTFEFPITQEVRNNISGAYLMLSVKQENCPRKDKCFSTVIASDIIQWFTPETHKKRILVSTSHSKSTASTSTSPSSSSSNNNNTKDDNNNADSMTNTNDNVKTDNDDLTPVPIRYRTIRFDIIVEKSPRNWNTLNPWEEPFIHFDRRSHTYDPIVLEDTFFNIQSEKRRINITNSNFTITVEVNMRGQMKWYYKNFVDYTISLIKYMFNEELSEYMKWQIDVAKRAFINTNPILLYTTIIATILHAIFQVLAFEKDLEFWANKKTFVGVSLRTLIMKLVRQVIVFLYVMDSDVTPSYIKVLEFLDFLKQLWVMKGLLKFTIRKFPFVFVKDEYKGETDDADAVGMKYLSYALFPLIVAYSIYQLFYTEFKSIKSYVLNCLTGAVYAFGFLEMIPQLYVNYRLKTVAGMSRSALGYKFITTFIDDLYTFVTDLPTLYKIACFRDDIIFIVWVVQCFMYPVDPTRANEYGLVEKSVLKEGDENDSNNENDENKLNDENDKIKLNDENKENDGSGGNNDGIKCRNTKNGKNGKDIKDDDEENEDAIAKTEGKIKTE